LRVIKLKISNGWHHHLLQVAEQRSMRLEDLLIEALTCAHPPPTSVPKWHDNEVAARRAHELSAMLQTAKNEILDALRRLDPPPDRKLTEHEIKRARIWAERRRTGLRLTQAMKAKGLVQRDVAKAIGVTRSAVASAFLGRTSLPPTWHNALIKLLGDDWMSE